MLSGVVPCFSPLGTQGYKHKASFLSMQLMLLWWDVNKTHTRTCFSTRCSESEPENSWSVSLRHPGIFTTAIVQPCSISAQVKRWKDKYYLEHIIVKGMDNWHACHQCPKVGLLMTAKLHLAPGMHRGRCQTSEHQTARSSVNLIALDMGFTGSCRPKERRGAKAKPHFLSHISFSSVRHALISVLKRRGVLYYYFRLARWKWICTLSWAHLQPGVNKTKETMHKTSTVTKGFNVNVVPAALWF